MPSGRSDAAGHGTLDGAACKCCRRVGRARSLRIRAIRTRRHFASGTRPAAFGGYHNIRHANTIPPTATPDSRASIACAREGLSLRALWLLAKTRSNTPRAGERHRLQAYMGNTFGKIATPSTAPMLEAFEG